jgi:1,4-alpha-glucan branching enzyme
MNGEERRHRNSQSNFVPPPANGYHGVMASVREEIAKLLRAEYSDPFGILGPHVAEGATVVRVLRPGATHVEILRPGHDPVGAAMLDPVGFFEASFPAGKEVTAYRLRVTYPTGSIEIEDPYAFPSLLGNLDLHLIGEGTHYQQYEKLGAHLRTHGNVSGVHFAVWAPNARRVSVVGDFNQWDGRIYSMRFHPPGIWEIFLPDLGEGEIYKYEILPRVGACLLKADPYGFFAEVRPKSGSVVFDLSKYHWEDGDWQDARRARNRLDAPMSVYEVHLASWRRKAVPDGEKQDAALLNYRELADQLIPYVVEMGFTHVELLPVMEHPFDGSWGYQTVGYFAATSRFGTPADFMYFVDRCHQAGLGVILDWTPGHFPKDGHGLGLFDGTHLYEHADPRQGEQPDWGTFVFNYGRNEVQNFLLSNALFWLSVYHLDGLRVDAVASMLYLDYSRQAGEWVPNRYGGRENLEAVAFLKRLNEVVHQLQPGCVTIAEESTSWPAVTRPTYLGGLGFDLKWNMGWMHDTLDYMALDPIHRKFHHNQITFSMMYAFSENFLLPLSHDEVVHLKGSLINKMPGDSWRQFANLRLMYAYLFAHPGKKLLFMGAEMAQRAEWKFAGQLDWPVLKHESHRGVQRLMQHLNHVYGTERSLHEVEFEWTGFQWLECNDADSSVLAFLRKSRTGDGEKPAEELLVALNFTPNVRVAYRIGVPQPGRYREILNTDSSAYWGSNVGNEGGVEAEQIPHNGWPCSISLKLPPLAAVYFKRV